MSTFIPFRKLAEIKKKIQKPEQLRTIAIPHMWENHTMGHTFEHEQMNIVTNAQTPSFSIWMEPNEKSN